MRLSFRNPSHRLCFIVLLVVAVSAPAATNLHTSWFWHLHQPIYWPDRRVSGNDHYEAAWDTIQQQDAGRPRPTPEVLRNIFGVDDRVNAYQGRLRDSLQTILGHANAGVQVSFSGALMENVQSLGAAGQLGYGASWHAANRAARSWSTAGGKPRMDLVNFTCHHSLAPLLSDETLEMELRVHQRQMEIFWTTNPPLSRGFFPTETCFSTRMIPILKRVGIEWAIIANSHLTRSCADFPLVLGSGGENCDIPNRADQLNPPQGLSNYKRIAIERGCAPTAAMPFAFQLHYARHVDPETGEESRLIVVPSDQALGWRDGYSTWDLNLMDDLAARNDPNKPALALFAHDGDNAWAGGYSYYMEWVQNFASQANSRGYELTTIEQFIQDHPPGTNDVVHVEDGGWVNADGDFGSPIFINWHWPPSYNVGGVNVVDPAVGVSDKADNWRVIVATENRVKTAQQIAGVTPRVDQVRDPGSFGATPSAVELGWHYYLGGLDSGFVYFGCVGDMCQRSAVAQSNVTRHVNAILTNAPAADTTPPTVFLPQRHPWNPGGTNFGVQYSYRVTVPTNSDFWVWTYAYDTSGITNVSLFLRVNGSNPPTSAQFKTYAGGPLTGPWTASNMTRRVVSPVTGANPEYIADYFFTKVRGVTNAYVDYYVRATDARGNICKSPIQHVWVGAGGQGSSGGGTNSCDPRVAVTPGLPAAGESVTVYYCAASGPLAGAASVYIHLGWNNWNPVVSPDAPMTFNAGSNRWEYTTPVPGYATQLDCVFNNGAGTWDNNGGADWHFVVTNSAPPPTNYPPFVMDGVADAPGFLLASNTMTLFAAVRGTKLYVATTSPGNGGGPNDHFLFVSDQLLGSATAPAPWAKSGQVAVATTRPYLAAESANSYIAWYNAPGGSPAFKASSSSGHMEGTIDLIAAFGAMPTNVYLCAAAYATADGGGLVGQAPAGSGPNIDPHEFLAIPTIALRDHNGDGKFDRLDPLLDFALQSIVAGTNGYRVTWAAMPNHAYQVVYRDSLGTDWLDLAGAQTTAGPLQIFLSWTDPRSTNVRRFYKIKLLE